MIVAQATVEDSGKRIAVRFPFSKAGVFLIKQVPGATFVPAEKGGPYWRLPLRLTTARRLGETFQVQPSAELRRHMRDLAREQRRLRALSQAKTAKLRRLPKVLPDLHRFIAEEKPGHPARHYQLADIAFMAQANAINANQPSLGKTIETIGAACEAGCDQGANLVLCPKTAIETVWVDELHARQDLPVLWTSGDDTPLRRQEVLSTALWMHWNDEPFWLVVNPAMVRFVGIYEHDKEGRRREVGTTVAYPEFFQIEWASATVDEFRRMGLTNPKTLSARALYALRAGRKWALDGTPVGGKPIKLWGGLHFTDPTEHSSLWGWAAEWLKVASNGFAATIGGVQEAREREFNKYMAARMVRRTKAEVRPQLPPKIYTDVLCRMAPMQRRQYEQFALDAEVRIGDSKVTASNVLAEYARLKQFANSLCTVEDGAVLPTTNSCKLPQLLDRLLERGLDEPGKEQAIVGTQFRPFAHMTHTWLAQNGIDSLVISGAVKGKARTQAVRAFVAGKARVLVVTTQAAGLSLNLDEAESVHILDETWDPDDQEQLEDRGHRFSGLAVYYYRTQETIEHYIRQRNAEKEDVNRRILDWRADGLRATRARAQAPARRR